MTGSFHRNFACKRLFLKSGERSGPSALILESLDGRLKTLLDALAMPDGQQGYEARDGEMLMYVLLEDDKLITKVSVETDRLLEAVTPKNDPNDVRLVITATIRPHEMHLGNMPFG